MKYRREPRHRSSQRCAVAYPPWPWLLSWLPLTGALTVGCDWLGVGDKEVRSLAAGETLLLLPSQVDIRIPKAAPPEAANPMDAPSQANGEEASLVVLATAPDGKGVESVSTRIILGRAGVSCKASDEDRVLTAEEQSDAVESLAELVADTGCTRLTSTFLQCSLGPTGSASFRVRARGSTATDLEIAACSGEQERRSQLVILSGISPDATHAAFVATKVDQAAAFGSGYLRCAASLSQTVVPGCRDARPRALPLVASVEPALPLQVQTTFVVDSQDGSTGAGHAWLSTSETCERLQATVSGKLAERTQRTDPVYLCADALGGSYRAKLEISSPLDPSFRVESDPLDVTFAPQPAVLRATPASTPAASDSTGFNIDVLDCLGNPIANASGTVSYEADPIMQGTWTSMENGRNVFVLSGHPNRVDFSVAGDACDFPLALADTLLPNNAEGAAQ